MLSLGRTPLANALLTEAQLAAGESTFPLDLARCQTCSLVQITETVPPDELFRDYVYFSSNSPTMVRHAGDLAGRLIASRRLTPASLVVELASNDGYLLQHYVREGIDVLGIEPARNIAVVAQERGIPTVAEFFSLSLARQLETEGRRADVVHANNVLAHVADLNGFVAGIARVLKPDGLAVIEFPYLGDLLDHTEFDTIYHEHLCYFSLTAIQRLFAAHGLTVCDVERLAIHGGSLRVYATRADGEMGSQVASSVTDLLAAEETWGVRDSSPYTDFASRVRHVRQSLRRLLSGLKQGGRRLVAYGASAKGSTLLNYCGIGRETLDYVVDVSPAKQGLYTPGTRLAIRSPQALLDDQPDFALLLTWNFAAEIQAQQAEYLARGGRFIVPVPEPRIL